MIYDKEHMRWIEYKKLSNGQTAIIAFNKNWMHEIGNGNDYSVAFAIANKKKVLKQWIDGSGYGDLDMTTTGSCGVEGLLWAYEMIKYFIENRLYKDDRIIVFGSDARRFRIYQHFLTRRLGFEKICDPYWGICLAKTLNKHK